MNLLEFTQEAFLLLVPMFLSLSVHEYAHGWMAYRLGDDTAEKGGRLTLNPLAHIDLLGTIILPLSVLLFNGALERVTANPALKNVVPLFGYAKPVPVNPLRFKRKLTLRQGMVLVALAGPLANLCLALLFGFCFSGLWHYGLRLGVNFAATAAGMNLYEALFRLLGRLVGINISLFVFNMLPIYPLDGQKVLSGLLPGEKSWHFERFSERYGLSLLLLLLVFGQNVLSYPVYLVTSGLFKIIGLA